MGISRRLPTYRRRDMAVDLGTANTVVYVRHEGIILFEPSVIAIDETTGTVQAVGEGAREAGLIEEPMAGAIGAGLPVAEPSGNMVVDIGGGTTEVAVISLGGIVVSRSLRVGGYEMDDAIVNHVRDHHRLLIGQERAEEAKIAVGSVIDVPELPDTEVSGRDLVTGGLRRMPLQAGEVRQALERPVSQIIDTVKQTP